MSIITLNTISYLIFNAFSTYVDLRLLRNFLVKNKIHGGLELLAGVIYFVVNSSLYLLFHNPFINLFSGVVGLIFISFLYQNKLVTRLIAVLTTYILEMIWETIPYVLLLKCNINDLSLSKGISSICMLATVLFIERHYRLKSTEKIDFIHGVAILSVSTGSMGIIALAYLANYKKETTLAITTILLYMNMMIYYLYDVVNKYYHHLSQEKLLEQQNFAYQNQLNIIQTTTEEMKIIRHDMKNHRIAMDSLIEAKRYSEARTYLQEMFCMTKEEAISDTGNIPLDSLLNYKIMQARQRGITVSAKIHIPRQFQVSTVHMSIILGNLLDNAIESVQYCNEKNICLELELDRGIIYFTIQNTYVGVVQQENGRILSRKRDHEDHGIGLYSVERALEPYNGNMSISTEGGKFTVDIIMYNSVKK